MNELSFAELYRAGKVDAAAVDDFVDRWHQSDSPLELHEFLGMTFEQYGAWVQDPARLDDLLADAG